MKLAEGVKMCVGFIFFTVVVGLIVFAPGAPHRSGLTGVTATSVTPSQSDYQEGTPCAAAKLPPGAYIALPEYGVVVQEWKNCIYGITEHRFFVMPKVGEPIELLVDTRWKPDIKATRWEHGKAGGEYKLSYLEKIAVHLAIQKHCKDEQEEYIVTKNKRGKVKYYCFGHPVG